MIYSYYLLPKSLDFFIWEIRKWWILLQKTVVMNKWVKMYKVVRITYISLTNTVAVLLLSMCFVFNMNDNSILYMSTMCFIEHTAQHCKCSWNYDALT